MSNAPKDYRLFVREESGQEAPISLRLIYQGYAFPGSALQDEQKSGAETQGKEKNPAAAERVQPIRSSGPRADE